MVTTLLTGLFYDIKLYRILTLVFLTKFPRRAVDLVKIIHQVIIGCHIVIEIVVDASALFVDVVQSVALVFLTFFACRVHSYICIEFGLDLVEAICCKIWLVKQSIPPWGAFRCKISVGGLLLLHSLSRFL